MSAHKARPAAEGETEPPREAPQEETPEQGLETKPEQPASQEKLPSPPPETKEDSKPVIVPVVVLDPEDTSKPDSAATPEQKTGESQYCNVKILFQC